MRVLVATHCPQSPEMQATIEALRLSRIWCDVVDPDYLSAEEAEEEIRAHLSAMPHAHIAAIVDESLMGAFKKAAKQAPQPVFAHSPPLCEEEAHALAGAIPVHYMNGHFNTDSTVISHKGLSLDITQNDVRVHDVPVHLDPQEYMLLRHLMLNAGRLCSYEEFISTFIKT